ncbi:MAG: PAS domain-containing protein [Raineya sp.]|jgi:PAS domain S-box-containing protein|nr:PAS domain-containing protein [Raineya sp.]
MTIPSLKPVQNFFEQVYQPVLIANEQNKLIYANPASLQLFNCTSSDLFQKPFSEAVSIAYDGDTEKRVVIRKLNGETSIANMLLTKVNYEGIPHSLILLSPVETVALSIEEKMNMLIKTIHRDIAQRELEMDKLSNEIEARTKVLNAAAIVSETDQFGTITFVNDNFCRVAKYTKEELIGKPHNIVRHPDMPKSVFKEMWDTIKSGKIFQGIVKNKAKDGTPYWVIATVAPVIDTNGKPYKYIGVRIDITELIKRGAKIEM